MITVYICINLTMAWYKYFQSSEIEYFYFLKGVSVFLLSWSLNEEEDCPKINWSKSSKETIDLLRFLLSDD